MLIGADLYGQTLLDGLRHAESGNLVAQNTIFGWVISGPLQKSSIHSSQINVHHSASVSIDQTLRKFWELKEVPIKNFLTKQELECEAHFAETHTRDSSGQYVVRLPFIEPPSQLGNSLNIALSSLSRLENRLVRDDDLTVKYRDFLREYESLDHISCLSPVRTDDSFRVFILHHPVLRDYSQTAKLRVVFNASRPTSTNNSINDCLHVGPKLQNDICSILLRWRQHPYVLCADIAHMFRQILIHPADRRFQCILWCEAIDEPIMVRFLNSTLSPMECLVPHISQFVSSVNWLDEKTKFPLAAPVFASETYVDDLFFGGVDQPSTLALRDQLIQLASSGGFRLCKWFSNCSDLLQGLDQTEHGLAMAIPFHDYSEFKVLGVLWCPSEDVFRFRISEFSREICTKRSLLSEVAKQSYGMVGSSCDRCKDFTTETLVTETWLGSNASP